MAVSGEVSLSALRTCSERIAQLIDQLRDERERRSELVVALVDVGADRAQIAEAGRMSRKSICTALAEYG